MTNQDLFGISSKSKWLCANIITERNKIWNEKIWQAIKYKKYCIHPEKGKRNHAISLYVSELGSGETFLLEMHKKPIKLLLTLQREVLQWLHKFLQYLLKILQLWIPLITLYKKSKKYAKRWPTSIASAVDDNVK